MSVPSTTLVRIYFKELYPTKVNTYTNKNRKTLTTHTVKFLIPSNTQKEKEKEKRNST